ncbi:MAG: hypothetical protein CMP91_02735 [Gammaproteobacteria bacterium]|nr:hypothetical protein [Gammaproteobacteria bacterium]MAY02421.1 hypothetical protein [Gammaproteobacteria bacterium]|tara:strand:- start:17002 stop:17373 length:372 start_codon:yes stop_codon:yes gene_type:complete
MYIKHLRNILIILTMGFLTSQAAAHHGWSWYGNEDFSLTATVVEIDFGNPHDRMTVEAEGQQWNLLLSPPSRTRRAGLSGDMIQVGDTITAYGHRDRNMDNFEMKTERLQVGENLYNLYPRRD